MMVNINKQELQNIDVALLDKKISRSFKRERLRLSKTSK
jgi:hypothetical protein